AAVLNLPRLGLLTALALQHQEKAGLPSGHSAALAALLLALTASLATHIVRRLRPTSSLDARRVGVWVVLPLVPSACALASAGLVIPPGRWAVPIWMVCLVWCVAVPLVGWGISEIAARVPREEPRIEKRPLMDGVAVLVSGLLPFVFLWAAAAHLLPAL